MIERARSTYSCEVKTTKSSLDIIKVSAFSLRPERKENREQEEDGRGCITSGGRDLHRGKSCSWRRAQGEGCSGFSSSEAVGAPCRWIRGRLRAESSCFSGLIRKSSRCRLSAVFAVREGLPISFFLWYECRRRRPRAAVDAIGA